MATCQHCGDEFRHKRRRGRKAKYCSAACRRQRNARNATPKPNRLPRREKLRRRRERLRRKIRRCPACGIEFVNRHGRNTYCSHECGMAPQRKLDRSEYGMRVCRQCGEPYMFRANRAGLYCSRQCYFDWKCEHGQVSSLHREARESKQIRAVADGYLWWLSRWSACSECEKPFFSERPRLCCSAECTTYRLRRLSKEKYVPKPRVLKCGQCPDCGDSVWVYGKAKRCDACAAARRRADKQKERVRYRSQIERSRIEVFDPVEVFERDLWKCQICGRTVNRRKCAPHPLSPTLDHIIPLSKGGKHSRKNTQLACWSCNIGKNNGSANDQLRLFG